MGDRNLNIVTRSGLPGSLLCKATTASTSRAAVRQDQLEPGNSLWPQRKNWIKQKPMPEVSKQPMSPCITSTSTMAAGGGSGDTLAACITKNRKRDTDIYECDGNLCLLFFSERQVLVAEDGAFE